MSQDPQAFLEPAAEPAPEPAPEPAEPTGTGVDRVDEVVAAVEQLEDRPIEEHVGVFERAHDELRRALDAQPEDPA
jgi:hypothetical protein